MLCMYLITQFLKNNPVFREYNVFFNSILFRYNLNRYNMKPECDCTISAVIDMTGQEDNLALLYTYAQLV